MKFDIWTFLFQIINFVVLLFILKRLLYKPVREIMEKRRGIVAKNIEEAEKIKKEALELQENYQKEMDKLKELRTQMIEKLQEEVEEERKKLISKAKEDASKVIEKERALFNTEKERLDAELKDKSIDVVSVFASNLLKDISDEDLHKAIFGRLFNELERIVSGTPKIKGEEEPLTIDIVTAYPLDVADVKKLQEKVGSLILRNVSANTIIDKTLIAGVKIKLYDMVYDFSLSGQINNFRSKLKETS
jgi:F-type H+-transporting ATPase subunit b